MKRVKKLFVACVLAIAVICVASVVYIDRLAKAGVEAGGEFAFGVPTRLDSASVGLLSGRSSLAGLNIANPQGFETAHLLKLDDAALAVSLPSLTRDTVEIPEFSLSGIDVNLESKGGKANFKTVLDNLGRFESSQEQVQESEGRKYVIREILVRDVTVNVVLLPIIGSATRVSVPIKELRLTDVGTDSSGGVILAQLAGTLLKAIILSALENGGGVIPQELLNELQVAMAGLAPLKDIGASLAVNVDGAFKELSGQVDAVGKQLTQQAEEAAKHFGDAVKGIQQNVAGEATQQLNDTANQAQQKLTEGLGGLFNKPKDKPE